MSRYSKSFFALNPVESGLRLKRLRQSFEGNRVTALDIIDENCWANAVIDTGKVVNVDSICLCGGPEQSRTEIFMAQLVAQEIPLNPPAP